MTIAKHALKSHKTNNIIFEINQLHSLLLQTHHTKVFLKKHFINKVCCIIITAWRQPHIVITLSPRQLINETPIHGSDLCRPRPLRALRSSVEIL